MLRDTRQAAAASSEVLIVGAGAVGLALGIKLARLGMSVTILEAGGRQPRADYRADNRGVNIGHDHRGLTEGRMRALGGTTRLWGGQLVAFGERDFDGDLMGEPSRWPVRHAEMQPYIREAFTFLGVSDRAIDQNEVWARATGRPAELGPDLRLGMNIWLPEPDFSRLFAKEIGAPDGPQIVTDAEVTRLLFDADGHHVTAVEVRSPDGTLTLFSAPRIVLANGTLEIARLLLRTAATQPGCGFAANDHIGRHYIDHIHGLAGTIEVDDPAALGRLTDNIYFEGRKYGVKIRAGDSLRERTAIANCAGTINPAISIGMMLRDLPMLARRILRPASSDARQAIGDIWTMSRIMLPLVWRYMVQRRSTSILSRGVSLGIELEQLPTSRSYLFLDPDSAPETARIGLHWGFDGRELDAAAALCHAIDAEFRKTGLGRITIDPRLLARDPAFLADCHDSNHQMGGSRMATSAEDGVVDRNLLVFGTDNLHVLGAAVYPSGSFANPTLTAIAFAMRLADHLANNRSGKAC